MDAVSTSPPALSSEETTLLLLIAEGNATTKVARSMAWSESTVRRRLKLVQSKLGANSRVNAVYVATRHGLI